MAFMLLNAVPKKKSPNIAASSNKPSTLSSMIWKNTDDSVDGLFDDAAMFGDFFLGRKESIV